MRSRYAKIIGTALSALWLSLYAAEADEIDTADLQIYTDTLMSSKVAVATTEDEFLILSAVIFRLVRLIDEHEGWGSEIPFDFVVAVSAPNILPNQEPPTFLKEFAVESLAEIVSEILIIRGECDIHDLFATNGDRILLILATAKAEEPTASLNCMLQGLSRLSPSNSSDGNTTSLRNGLINILRAD